jgi:hypothetical protein
MSTENTPVEPVTPEKTKTRQMSFSLLETGEIRADFGPELEAVTLDPAAVPESLQAAAMAEGLISRLRGYTSKLSDDAEDPAHKRTPENLRAAVQKGVVALLAGIWKIERAPGTGEAEYSMEVEAAFRFRASRAKSKGETFTDTLAQVAEIFGALTEDQKKQLKALPRYQACLAEVKAERAAAKAAKLAKKADDLEDEAPM